MCRLACQAVVAVVLLVTAVVGIDQPDSDRFDCAVCLSVVAEYETARFKCSAKYGGLSSLLSWRQCSKLKQYLRDHASSIWLAFDTKDDAIVKICESNEPNHFRTAVRNISKNRDMCKSLLKWLPRWEGVCSPHADQAVLARCFDYDRALATAGKPIAGDMSACNDSEVKETLGMREGVVCKTEATIREELWKEQTRQVILLVDEVNKISEDVPETNILGISHDVAAIKTHLAVIKERVEVVKFKTLPENGQPDLVRPTGQLLVSILNEMIEAVISSLDIYENSYQVLKDPSGIFGPEGPELLTLLQHMSAKNAGYTPQTGAEDVTAARIIEGSLRDLDLRRESMGNPTDELMEKMKMDVVAAYVHEFVNEVSPNMPTVFGTAAARGVFAGDNNDATNPARHFLGRYFSAGYYIASVAKFRRDYRHRVRDLRISIMKDKDEADKVKKSWRGLSEDIPDTLVQLIAELREEARIVRAIYLRFQKYLDNCESAREAFRSLDKFREEISDLEEGPFVASSTVMFLTSVIDIITSVVTDDKGILKCSVLDQRGISVLDVMSNNFNEAARTLEEDVVGVLAVDGQKRSTRSIRGLIKTIMRKGADNGLSPGQTWADVSEPAMLHVFRDSLGHMSVDDLGALQYLSSQLHAGEPKVNDKAIELLTNRCADINELAHLWGEGLYDHDFKPTMEKLDVMRMKWKDATKRLHDELKNMLPQATRDHDNIE